MMEESVAVRALGALAQEARLRVFRALVGAGPEGLTPGELSTRLGIPASTLSFHLRELLDSGLASVARTGRQLHYRPELARMDALMAYLTDHCCNGAPCKPAARVAGARRRAPAAGQRKHRSAP
jgi:DNA-binding transcriptional ArsR family regulator